MSETMVPLSWLTTAQERARAAEALAEQLKADRRRRYRFIGRDGDTYVWEATRRTDSRVEQIRCGVAWFWGTAYPAASGASVWDLVEWADD